MFSGLLMRPKCIYDRGSLAGVEGALWASQVQFQDKFMATPLSYKLQILELIKDDKSISKGSRYTLIDLFLFFPALATHVRIPTVLFHSIAIVCSPSFCLFFCLSVCDIDDL